MVGIMNNDEQPVPPEARDVAHTSRYSYWNVVLFFACSFTIGFLVGIIAIYKTSDFVTVAARISQMETRFDTWLEESYTPLTYRHVELIHASRNAVISFSDINDQIRDMKAAMIAKKKRIVDVPLGLTVATDTAHDLMMNGYIMRDEYRAFASKQHNMAINTLVTQFLLDPMRSVLFNLHYVNQKYGIRFTTVIASSNQMLAVEGVNTTFICVYKKIDPIGSWMGYNYPDGYDELITIPSGSRITQTCG
jgi:hypothetical protein